MGFIVDPSSLDHLAKTLRQIRSAPRMPPAIPPRPYSLNPPAKSPTPPPQPLPPKKIVWTNGCFDLLHSGHVRSLIAARQRGDYLFVGINSDASVARLKGPNRPLVPAEERAELVAALECANYVTVFDEDTPEKCIAQLRPDVVCKGIEYITLPMPERDLVHSYGGAIEYLPRTSANSTTEIVRKILRIFLDSRDSL